jgi:hypothetical protein
VAGSSRELDSRAKAGLPIPAASCRCDRRPQADDGVDGSRVVSEAVEFRANTGLRDGRGRRRMGDAGMARRTALVVPITNHQRLERLEKGNTLDAPLLDACSGRASPSGNHRQLDYGAAWLLFDENPSE